MLARPIVRWTPRPGRRRKIPEARAQELCDLLENPQAAGQIHWTGKKFHGTIRERLDCEIGYSAVMRRIGEQGFRLKVPQPWPDRQDEEKRAEFIGRLRHWLQDENVELRFMGEMGSRATLGRANAGRCAARRLARRRTASMFA